MTFKQRMILLCAICLIFSGLLVSYKSFELANAQNEQTEMAKRQEAAEWISLGLEQKIKQLEASVSYLDQSTVESLRRMGARYFAYAFQKDNEWSIKWKVLGDEGKEQILSEVNEIKFSSLSQKVRTWAQSKDGKGILVAPVELAESHQLTSGFLVFGVNDGFFAEYKTEKGPISLMSPGLFALSGEIPQALSSDKNAFAEQGDGFLIETGTVDYFASFSATSQLWILQQASRVQASYMTSPFFTYFLLAGFLSLTVFLLLGMAFLNASEPLHMQNRWKLPRFDFAKKQTAQFDVEEPQHTSHQTTEVELVEDFSELLDTIVADEVTRLEKVGVSIKTQVEEGARLYCSPQHIGDFVRRLIGNSVICLEHEEEKEIQIQLVEQSDSYQLIYVDTRTSHFPTGGETSLLAQTEGSLEGIDGIVAYATWMFGDSLTLAKTGFCLSVDLPKFLTESQGRIEIFEEDTDHELFTELQPLELQNSEVTDVEAEPTVDFEDVIDQFRMKEFSFNSEVEEAEVDSEEVAEEHVMQEPEQTIVTDDKGLFEFNSGQIKIKIRSPKKRDKDVHS